MKPMLITPGTEIPRGPEWYYEVKYDGFRALMDITETGITLTSRNGKALESQFPELVRFIENHRGALHPFLPLTLDGELVWLENEMKSDFKAIQLRGRLRTNPKIEKQAQSSPCRLLAFDILLNKGKSLLTVSFLERKKMLDSLFQTLGWPLSPDPLLEEVIQLVPARQKSADLWENIILHNGEGLIAKHRDSRYLPAKRNPQWVKIKNKKTVHCFILSFHKANQYFTLGLYKDSSVISIGSVKDGFTKEEKQTLISIIKNNYTKEDQDFYYLSPSICVAVKYLHLYENELREPHFDTFLLQTHPEECTWQAFVEHSNVFPDKIKISNPGKLLWNSKEMTVSKIEYLNYLQEVSAHLLFFCKRKAMTVIRYPDGIEGERFFQKNCPDYAPSFVETVTMEDINYIICSRLDTLLWLGNMASIEFHTPFQEAGRANPDDLVLDLDPPSPGQFPLAVKAALEIKKITDSLRLFSLIKTSGNRGLQLHLPLPKNTFTYKDTRLFTDFLGSMLTRLYPDEFTTERMIKQRESRLYLDFVQHARGKTIITPYSARANSFGGAATPLFWEEVNDKLSLKDFTIKTVPGRIRDSGCPFKEYEGIREKQPFKQIIDYLKQGGKI
ncbi:DNA ligase D [Peribacillus kribbensis]|uniref:DNA ligase D n=1 Tax=Peribacillus kribbensis TaxID=356658 RepID=UPI000428E3B0|nr:DNA ligase D [Peribacillus kribbensis]